MQNDTVITMRCTKELRDKLKAQAKEVNMPVSVYIRIILSRLVKE